MRVDDFDFDLPPENIALRPASPRDSARMLVVNGDTPVADAVVSDLPQFLRPGDVLVSNDTKVIAAQLKCLRANPLGPDAKIDITLHMQTGPLSWKAFARPAKKLSRDDKLTFIPPGTDKPEGTLRGTVVDKGEAGEVEIAFETDGAPLEPLISAYGEMPLPPYIASRRPTDGRDLVDYQTLFADKTGAVAAPTAGLHFTDELVAAIRAKDVELETITLHVGAGTFLPVKAEDTADHKMHAERGIISPEKAEHLNKIRQRGGRIIAVGTTSLRLLESASDAQGNIRPFDGETDIFITPGYQFRAVDALLTNFHLPRSTLFMLVSAFAGQDQMRTAYAHAIAENYRFYSYGDASLLFPAANNGKSAR